LPDFSKRYSEALRVRAKKNVRKNVVAKTGKFSLALMRVRGVLVVVLPVLFVIGAGYLIASAARSAFVVNTVVFTGNAHLSDDELRSLAGLKGGENLMTLSSADIYGKISASPWIRSVSVRKEFPDRLDILVRETEPFALLDMKGRLFIVDERGKLLEELRESSMPFLPIISGDPFGDKEVFSEAIRLVRAVKETGLMTRKNRIEIIARKLNEIAVNLDGVVVKVGAGEYEDKLSRLAELEEEILNRHIPVDYIDLRFANRVVVKPVNEVVR
jgi:cell division protein FtsQ